MQQPTKAAYIYKWVEEHTKDAELKGQALFNLGMIYHFGSDGAIKLPSITTKYSHEG